MQADPQRSGHGIPLLVGAMSCAKIHRGCTDYLCAGEPLTTSSNFLRFCLVRLGEQTLPACINHGGASSCESTIGRASQELRPSKMAHHFILRASVWASNGACTFASLSK